MINSNPTIYDKTTTKEELNYSDNDEEIMTNYEIFELIKNINDPEHPLSLEQLNVVKPDDIIVKESSVTVYFPGIASPLPHTASLPAFPSDDPGFLIQTAAWMCWR
jgi:hypothetical protein